MAAPDNKFNFNFKKEALPHMIEPYQEAARGSGMQEFVSQVPYPFLIYVRSKLWDPLLLLARQRGGGTGSETAIVSYDIEAGGHSFMSPVRKRQTDPTDPSIFLGRDTINDLVVPVNSISARHCRFVPPATPNGKWQCIDLGTKNGTFLREDRLEPNRPYDVDSGTYLRLGGNLMAWFLLPDRVWEVLRSPTQLKAMTDS
jgi:hypothetical protein